MQLVLAFQHFVAFDLPMYFLLKNTPKDQCKCKTHENFRMKLKVLDSDMVHDKDCWQSIICNTSDFQSNFWTGTCETCKGGKLLEAKLSGVIDMAKATEWHHWENDENQVLKKLTKSGCYGELLDLVLQSLPEAQEHTRVKRIQSNAFESLKEANRILQIDFAMAYSCEYQDEMGINAPAADGIRRLHDAHCIFKDHKIELRHVTGQTESDVVIHYEQQSQLPGTVHCYFL